VAYVHNRQQWQRVLVVAGRSNCGRSHVSLRVTHSCCSLLLFVPLRPLAQLLLCSLPEIGLQHAVVRALTSSGPPSCPCTTAAGG
jgi:hypothetical protein